MVFPRKIYDRANYFDEMDDLTFFKRFRLTKPTVLSLLEEIEDQLEFDHDRNNSVSPINQLLTSLRFYATGEHLSSIGDFMGIHEGTASRTIEKVSAILARLRPFYIKMPQGEEVINTQNKFFHVAAFPRVIGCIDCTHVRIISPGGDDGEVFRNRKGYFSVNVQAVCDSSLKLSNIVARWPGSAHDSTIFANSRLRTSLESNEFPNCILLDPPEISVERSVVHSAEGYEAQLVCIVHGESQPEVLWYRDTMQLDTTEQRIMESRGSRHTLVIRKVHRSDFGNYTCVADNQLGKTRKSIQLTGKPNPAKFSSASRGNWKDSYNISWAVESLSPIQEYKLLFRRLPESSTDDGHPQPLHHQSQRKFIPGKENKTYASVGYSVGYGYGRQFIDRRTDWRDVILPATASPSQTPAGVQSMSYVIRGLESGQNYEAKVQARNKFGWSPISEAFTFQTTDTDMGYPDRPQSPKHIYNEHEISPDILGISLGNASTFSVTWKFLPALLAIHIILKIMS